MNALQRLKINYTFMKFDSREIDIKFTAYGFDITKDAPSIGSNSR